MIDHILGQLVLRVPTLEVHMVVQYAHSFHMYIICRICGNRAMLRSDAETTLCVSGQVVCRQEATSSVDNSATWLHFEPASRP